MELKLTDINKSFGAKHVLRDISFSAVSGRALGLLGRNGAGKTTTIRIIMNVFGADSGIVAIDGTKPDYSKLRVGYLPEERGLYPKRKIIDQLTYLAQLKGVGRKVAIESIDYWLSRLEMTEYRNVKLDTLSKGNQQKIQLISAICSDPDIVILDEPFSGLDPVNSIMLKDVVRELIQKGKIVIFSSHQMSYIEEFCDDIAIISNGKIVLCGALRDIIRSYPRDMLIISSSQCGEIERFLPNTCKYIKNELVVSLDKPEDKSKIMAMLAEKFDIDSISVHEPSLNEIFVAYTTAEEVETDETV